MDNPIVTATVFGLISSISLPLGALLGVYWRPSDKMMAFFLANFPEALSSSASMKDQGFKILRIMSIWTAIMVMTGVCAGLGAIALKGAPAALFALLEGIAAGAMLTVVAETMLPEAFLKSGNVVGLSTLAGFLMAILFKTLN